MKYRYYKTFCFLNLDTQIAEEEISLRKLYYRFYLDPEFLIEIGERFLNGKFDQVFYKGGTPEVVQKYHQENFPGNSEYNIIQNLTDFTILIKIYKENLFNGAEIFNYNNNYDQIENLIFDSAFMLQEFHSTSNNSGHFERKIFLAYDWRIMNDY